jgi:hypothetical protein
MSKERSRHAASKGHRWRRWNRGDLVILLCGILAFFSISFGTPMIQQAEWSAHGSGTETTSAPSASSSIEPAPIAVTGTPEGATPAPADSVAQQASGLPAAAAPVRIRYPSAVFDVPVHALELDAAAQEGQTIVPPATKDGYWLTPFGAPGNGSANTTYVIGHSWEGADAPFNRLSSAARAGDVFEVDTLAGTIPYRVDSVTTYLKSGLKDSPIWEIVPNRLVLISCYTEDPWGKNVVLTASPATS